ncbi:serine/threonine-protein kinase [Gaiella sp.]|uniref:serine/threonine-protein kinase n=1 Tax=Gaiella sp. TaxID=2663207 RepID=UPI0032667783
MSSTAYALPTPELVLDRYRPLRPIGRGGSGSVWLARDERTGLEVALKIVPREGKRASRAAREMEAASRLRHERCVRAYDFGGDSGHVYIAYEYVEGQTMREALRSGKLSDRDSIEAAAQILDALAHAHGLGIVHRDVKPSNVLVEEGPELSIRLLDFGLAQFDEADTLTAVGDVPGTLAYIAPERLTGGDATTASDVWAVGVLLWESLVGEHPFWGVPLPQVAAAIESGAAPLAEKRSDLPPALTDAVSSALTVDATRRPSAERLARDLRTAVTSPRRDRTGPARERRPAPTPRVATAALPLEQRLVPAGLAAIIVVIGATLLPFWTPGLTILLALAAALSTLRSPRLGLALALSVPLFPLGNVAQAAAVTYGALAVLWFAFSWRDARAGLLFMTGPVLAAIGAIALLPLAVQPARGRARRALQAFAGVFAAVAVAGLRGGPLPLTGDSVSNLGVAGSTSLAAVVGSVVALLQENPWFVALATVLAGAAALLPDARKRGFRGIALLGACQIGLILFLAPTLSALSIVLGTFALCAILATRTFQAGRYP